VNPSSKLGRLGELTKKLAQARIDYTNGTPTVSDEVFDAWRDEAMELSKEFQEASDAVFGVGSPVDESSEWPKVRHSTMMGSLDKVQIPDQMTAWVGKLSRKPHESYLVTEKMDGISINLRYENGVLVQATTRGDGVIGEDITPNVLRMKGLPKDLESGLNITIRGEIVLCKSDFKAYFPDKANPRNTAAGVSKRSDGKGCEHLTVITYQIQEGYDSATEYEQFHHMASLGFTLPNFSVVYDAAGVNSEWNRYQAGFRDSLDYEIDGLVVRLNDLPYQYSLGEVNGCPQGVIAYKFTPIAKETTIREIIWQVGSIGRITPVAVFDTVNLLGAETSRASLYNLKYVEDLGVDIGAKVLVIRANDVIPRVHQVVTSTGTLTKPPHHCPVCKTETVRDGEYIVCPNVSECPAQVVGRIKQWVGELGILEWGEAVIQKLVDAGYVTNVADLYRLKQDQVAALDRMGDKSAKNVLKTLWAASNMPLESLLGGLSIPLCATSTIRLLVDAGLDSVDKIAGASVDQLQAIPGMGPKRARALVAWFKKHRSSVDDILSVGVKVVARAQGSLTGKSVCFTGKSTRKRAELEQMATSAGGTVKNSVGKGLTYLVLADPDSTSSKAVAARKNGTTCISEEAFVAMCGAV